MKSNKKGFYRYICSKRKTRENVGPLLNGAGGLMTKNMAKAEILKAFFSQVFNSKICLQGSLGPKTCKNVQKPEDLPSAEKGLYP